ncbi:MAG TPA: hypothetical protein VHI13_20120 [Candidatus Kapabacteria bacterium]|nr:hypothetical protein [Candidatus Kapabacteria bacterium]
MSMPIRNRSRVATLLAVAMVAVLASMSFGTGRASACCTTAIIDNLSNCTFQVCYTSPAGGTDCRLLAQGSNLFFWGTCTDPNFTVTDRCGHVIPFPGLGACIDVPITATCCIHICCSATNSCQFQVTNGVCAAC